MRRISGEQLAREKPSADCTDCGREADQARSQTWVELNGRFYCARCAENEGLT